MNSASSAKFIMCDCEMVSSTGDSPAGSRLPTRRLLCKPGYKTSPPWEELSRAEESRLSSVENFRVENRWGRVEWLESVDLRAVDLSAEVEIGKDFAEVYRAGRSPPRGTGLNFPAMITLFRFETFGVEDLAELEPILRKRCEDQDAEFVSLSKEGGFVFKVAHFTKYSFLDSLLEDNDSQNATEIRPARRPVQEQKEVSRKEASRDNLREKPKKLHSLHDSVEEKEGASSILKSRIAGKTFDLELDGDSESESHLINQESLIQKISKSSHANVQAVLADFGEFKEAQNLPVLRLGDSDVNGKLAGSFSLLNSLALGREKGSSFFPEPRGALSWSSFEQIEGFRSEGGLKAELAVHFAQALAPFALQASQATQTPQALQSSQTFPPTQGPKIPLGSSPALEACGVFLNLLREAGYDFDNRRDFESSLSLLVALLSSGEESEFFAETRRRRRLFVWVEQRLREQSDPWLSALLNHLTRNQGVSVHSALSSFEVPATRDIHRVFRNVFRIFEASAGGRRPAPLLLEGTGFRGPFALLQALAAAHIAAAGPADPSARAQARKAYLAAEKALLAKESFQATAFLAFVALEGWEARKRVPLMLQGVFAARLHFELGEKKNFRALLGRENFDRIRCEFKSHENDLRQTVKTLIKLSKNSEASQVLLRASKEAFESETLDPLSISGLRDSLSEAPHLVEDSPVLFIVQNALEFHRLSLEEPSAQLSATLSVIFSTLKLMREEQFDCFARNLQIFQSISEFLVRVLCSVKPSALGDLRKAFVHSLNQGEWLICMNKETLGRNLDRIFSFLYAN